MDGPKARWLHGEERLAAVDELVAELNSALSRMSSRPELAARHFAALAVARGVRLLEAMLALRRDGFADVVPILDRPMIEVYAVGMYCLLGGDEAYDHVRGAHVRDLRNMSGFGDMAEAKKSTIDKWGEGPTDKLNWQDLIKVKLPALMNDDDPTVASFHTLLYDLSYRGGSAEVHAGVASIANHMRRTETALSVERIRYTPDDGLGAIVYAANLLGILATTVLDNFGFDVTRLSEIVTDIGASAADDLVVEGEEIT